MPNHHSFRCAPLLAVVCLLIGILGCGSSTADVTGTIKIGGQPPKLKGLEIVFLSDDGCLVSFPIQEDGSYFAAAVPTGVVKVGFNYITAEVSQGNGKPPPRLPRSQAIVPASVVQHEPKTKNPIPKTLREASWSGLTFKVEAGKSNVFDYDVKP